MGYSRGAEIVFCLEIARVGVFWIKFQGAEIFCMEMPTGHFGLMSSTRIKNVPCHSGVARIFERWGKHSISPTSGPGHVGVVTRAWPNIVWSICHYVLPIATN